MNKKQKTTVRWITETAVLTALLVALQAITKPLGQYVTGSCVNAVLVLAVLVAGLYSGLTVALVSPVMAFLLGVAPNPFVVPAIMVGNTVYVLVLHFVCHNRKQRKFLPLAVTGWLLSAAAKFATLYLIVVQLMCGVLADSFGKGFPAKMLQVTFSWPQLITALIGGAVALSVVPVLKRILKR